MSSPEVAALFREGQPTLHGAIASFESPDALLAACRSLRDRKLVKFDAFTPYPIHGIEEAMGVSRSYLPGLVMIGGLAGTITAYLLTWWTSAGPFRDLSSYFAGYPLVVGGKNYNSTEAFVPIFFELTILFSAFTTIFGMFALNRLPKFFHPVFKHEAFLRASDDGFFIVIQADDPEFDREQSAELLRNLGGQNVTLLED